MSDTTVDLMDDVQKQALEKCRDLSLAMIASQMGTDGNVYGNVSMTRGQRIARFEDYAARGMLDALVGMDAPVYDQLVREFIADMDASPYMKPAPVTIPYVLKELMGAR